MLQVRKETILNIFPGADDSHRLVVVIEQVGDGPSGLVLRQETFAPDVGWFVQSQLPIEPCQVTGLKMALASRSAKPVSKRPTPITKQASELVTAKVLPFGNAVACQAG